MRGDIKIIGTVIVLFLYFAIRSLALCGVLFLIVWAIGGTFYVGGWVVVSLAATIISLMLVCLNN